MTKLIIELDLDTQGEKYTPEQIRFIERHFFGNLALLLEQGGLGDMIPPEIDWDNQQEADQLFGSEDNDETVGKHLDAVGLAILYLDNLYDACIEGVTSRGGKYVSMYEGGCKGEAVYIAVPLETQKSLQDRWDDGEDVEKPEPLNIRVHCALCEDNIGDGEALVVGGKLYHHDCGQAMTRNLEEQNARLTESSN